LIAIEGSPIPFQLAPACEHGDVTALLRRGFGGQRNAISGPLTGCVPSFTILSSFWSVGIALGRIGLQLPSCQRSPPHRPLPEPLHQTRVPGGLPQILDPALGVVGRHSHRLVQDSVNDEAGLGVLAIGARDVERRFHQKTNRALSLDTC